MTTLDTARLVPAHPIFARFGHSVTLLWAGVRERRNRRQAKTYLTRADARLLADMGVDPEEIQVIARRREDELDPWHYHGDAA